MKQVLKFPLPLPGQMLNHRVSANHAKVVHVGLQNNQPMVWIECVKDDLMQRTATLHCFGTGWDVPDEFEHIGTIIDLGGFVWHYYLERR